MTQQQDQPAGALIGDPPRYELRAAIGLLGRRRRVYDGLVALSGARPGDRVLDVGCGTGYLTRRAARAVGPGGRAVGIDPSAPMVAYAERRAAQGCTFQTGAAQSLPHADGSFDVVVSSMVVHHLPAGDQAPAVAEMLRVLRPGGRLLLADFHRLPRHLRALQRIGLARGHARKHGHGDAREQIGALAGDLPGLVAQAGFRVTGTGRRWPSLEFVQAERPGAAAAPEGSA